MPAIFSKNLDRIQVRFEHLPSSRSWPGLSRPPRLSLLYALKFGVAGISAVIRYDRNPLLIFRIA
jgi:hypothetical protein